MKKKAGKDSIFTLFGHEKVYGQKGTYPKEENQRERDIYISTNHKTVLQVVKDRLSRNQKYYLLAEVWVC